MAFRQGHCVCFGHLFVSHGQKESGWFIKLTSTNFGEAAGTHFDILLKNPSNDHIVLQGRNSGLRTPMFWVFQLCLIRAEPFRWAEGSVRKVQAGQNVGCLMIFVDLYS
jgi:hypothetical protein